MTTFYTRLHVILYYIIYLNQNFSGFYLLQEFLNKISLCTLSQVSLPLKMKAKTQSWFIVNCIGREIVKFLAFLGTEIFKSKTCRTKVGVSTKIKSLMFCLFMVTV
jgi:hypothetical protein